MSVFARILAGVTAAVGLGALALQSALILEATRAAAASGAIRFPVGAAVVVFLSFFTLQINSMAVAITACAAAGVERFVRDGRWRAAIAAYSLAGSIVFMVALQPYWHHRGWQFAADTLLHNVMPVLYTAFWLLAAPKDRLRWRDPVVWLVYPAVYLALLLIIAQWTGFFPYPFIDTRVLGVGALVINLLALGGVFLAVGLAIVAVARIIDPPADAA
jgi:hypothetical protein